jgi:hypothetical protein
MWCFTFQSQNKIFTKIKKNYMLSFYSKEIQLEIHWIPKSGCTTVAHWYVSILLQNCPHLIEDFEKKKQQILKRMRETHALRLDPQREWLLTRDLSNNNQTLPKYRILVTREPFERFVSAYINKFVICGDTPLKKFEDLEDFSKEIVLFIEKNTDCVVCSNPYTGVSISDVLRYVECGGSDSHFTSAFDKDSSLDVYDHVIQIENGDLLGKLNVISGQTFGYKYCTNQEKTNRTRFPEDWSLTNKTLVHVKSTDIIDSKIQISKKNCATLDFVERLYEQFPNDSRLFGYDPHKVV